MFYLHLQYLQLSTLSVAFKKDKNAFLFTYFQHLETTQSYKVAKFMKPHKNLTYHFLMQTTLTTQFSCIQCKNKIVANKSMALLGFWMLKS